MTDYTAAQLQAFDRAYEQAKQSGALMSDADKRALNDQIIVDALQEVTE